eukprot:symbB.v1.2.005024.t1/scaffold287.1/size239285/2
MPDAKSRKDRKPSAPKRAAPQRTSQVEGHGKNSRRWRWSSTLICLVGIQALAVLSLWHSHSFNPPRVEPAVPPVLELEAIPIPPESSAPGPDFVGDTAREGDIAVLLIASGRSVSSLKQTLKSLLRNFPVSSILVSQAAPGEASRELAVDLGVSWVGPSPITDWAIFDGEAEPWLHYGRSLDYAVTKHFGEKFRSLFVAEEDLIFSSGLYSFLSQLHPLLFQDESLWCISAWNDYSFSSFVKDVSVVLRSDWFAGRAFMVTLQLIRQELLPNWSLQQRWRPLLRQLASAGSKECLMPEVSRAAFTSYQCDSVGIRGQCDEEEVEARRNAPVSIFARGDAKLGDVQRLKNTRYLALLGSSWPKNGALQKARCITVLQELYEDATTPLLVVIDDKERTDMSTWVSLGMFVSAKGNSTTFDPTFAENVIMELQLPPAKICLLKELSNIKLTSSIRVTGEVKEVKSSGHLVLHDRGSMLHVDISSLIRPTEGIVPGIHLQAVGELVGGPDLLLKARIVRVLHHFDMSLYEECLQVRRGIESQFNQ